MTGDLPRPGSFKKITSLTNPRVKEIRALGIDMELETED